MIDTTDPTPAGNHPAEGQLERPAWAVNTQVNVDSVDQSALVLHTWTAPPALVHVSGDELPTVSYAQVSREVRVAAPGGSLEVVSSNPYIFLSALDARFTSTAQARAFAANLVEACDRLDGEASPAAVPDGSVTISVVPRLGAPFAWWPEDRHLAIQQGTPAETAAALREAADRLDGAA